MNKEKMKKEMSNPIRDLSLNGANGLEKVFVSDIDKYLDQEVKIQGWVYNFRSSGSL